MDTYRLFFILLTFLCTTDICAGSRKRYRRNKSVLRQAQDERLRQAPASAKASSFAKASADKNQQKNIADTLRTHIDVDSNLAHPLTSTLMNAKQVAPTRIVYDKPPLPLHVQKKKKHIKTHIDVPENEEDEPEVEEEDSIELNFENADLLNFIKQIEDIFEVTFITNDALEPTPEGGKVVKGNKISFKTHRALSKQEAWNLFITFLEISGFAVIPYTDPTIYRIIKIEAARKSPLPTFIGINYQDLPETDEIIRYVYFIENTTVETIKSIIEPLISSAAAPPIMLNEHKGFVLTDKAYNIKKLMEIVKELDKVSIPESMSILKLRNADAKQVAELYTSLLPKQETTRFFTTKKQPTSLYFPENTRVIAEPRTNALILLGPKNAIKKIEQFILKHIDVELDQAYSPLYVYQLKYADATTIAEIMNNVTQFGKETEAGRAGGVRGIDQYMRPMSFTPEKETNRLIIKGYYEDYLKAKEVIEKLDEAQPQVAIEVLILSVTLNNNKSLGAQIRTKEPGPDGLFGKNIKFQTSGLFNSGNIQTRQQATLGTQRLLGNLLNLVSGASPGNTIVTFGRDVFGVWGIFQILQTITNAEILSNPFLLATNKAPAEVSLGEERRVVTATIVGTGETDAFSKDEAKLEVKITPQINSDGMIILDLNILINDFVDTANRTDATKNIKEIKTSTIVADKEVLALGGLIRNNITSNVSKVPVLGSIPVLGWLFKNKSKIERKENLLILISTRIIEPFAEEGMQEFTQSRVDDYHGTMGEMDILTERRDPIHSMFFKGKEEKTARIVEDFIFERRENTNTLENKKKRSRRSRRRQNKKTKSTKEKITTPPILKEEEVEENTPLELTQHKQPKQEPNKFIEKIQHKKRTQLSLTEFLQDKGERT